MPDTLPTRDQDHPQRVRLSVIPRLFERPAMKILNGVRAWCLAWSAMLAPGLASVPQIAHAQSNVVVFAGWGGTIERAQRQIFFDSFEKQTGIKVIDVPDVQLPKIKAMVDAGTVQWDVVQSLGMWIPEGAKEKPVGAARLQRHTEGGGAGSAAGQIRDR